MQQEHAFKFYRIREVENLTGIPRSTIYELAARGDFPKPVKLSPRISGWPEPDLIAWQRERLALREDA